MPAPGMVGCSRLDRRGRGPNAGAAPGESARARAARLSPSSV